MIETPKTAMTTDYSEIDERTLFKLKGWRVVRSKWPKGTTNCYAVHMNCEHPNLLPNIPDHCFRCGEGVPDEIYSLVAMNNWESQ